MDKAETRALIDALDWIAISPRLTKVESTAREILETLNHPCRAEAQEILDMIARVQSAHQRGVPIATREFMTIERLCAVANAKTVAPFVIAGATSRESLSKGGKKAAALKRNENAKRNSDIHIQAAKLRKEGQQEKAVVSIIAETAGLSDKQVRRILKESVDIN